MNCHFGMIHWAYCVKVLRARGFEGVVAALRLCNIADNRESRSLAGMSFCLWLREMASRVCLRQGEWPDVMIVAVRISKIRGIILQLSISIFEKKAIE
jgi:hypothetical protein